MGTVTAGSPDRAGVFTTLAELLEREEVLAMATVVGRRGSTPREVGAKMLVRPSGAIAGTVGGGAAEAEIRRQALLVLRAGRPELVTVDLTGTLQRPGRGICGGSFDVFLEPWRGGMAPDPTAGPSRGKDLELAKAIVEEREAGRAVRLATVIGASGRWAAGAGSRVLAGDSRTVSSGPLAEDLLAAVVAATEGWDGSGGVMGPAGSSTLVDGSASAGIRELLPADSGAQARVLLELLLPPDQLLIVGGGHIAQPLAAIATTCGLDVTVVDDRPEYATQERFPQARVVAADGGRFLAQRPGLGPRTHVVLVSRGPAQDLAALQALLTGGGGGYVGLIGSERRVWTVLTTLGAAGVSAEQLARVHGPVGLDLGGTAPAEIALAIMAELVKWQRGGTGQELSDRMRRRLGRRQPGP